MIRRVPSRPRLPEPIARPSTQSPGGAERRPIDASNVPAKDARPPQFPRSMSRPSSVTGAPESPGTRVAIAVTSRRAPRSRGRDRSPVGIAAISSATRVAASRCDEPVRTVRNARSRSSTPRRSARGRCRSRPRRRRRRSPTGRRTTARRVAVGRATQRRAPCRLRRGRRRRWPAEQIGLRDEPFDADVGRYGAERRRVDVGPMVATASTSRPPTTANSSRHGNVTDGGSVPDVTYTKGRSVPSEPPRLAGATLGEPRSGRIGRTTGESGRWPNETGNGWRYSCP